MSIRKRLEALERATPAGVVLYLDNGTTIEYSGPALEFYAEVQDQILRKEGPLYQAASRIVSATGFGKLHEVLLAMAEGPIQKRIGDSSLPRNVARARTDTTP